jgi:hypothetical protein
LRNNLRSKSARCLTNVPINTISSYFSKSYLSGTIFDINTQCQLIYGAGSSYEICKVILNSNTIKFKFN